MDNTSLIEALEKQGFHESNPFCIPKKLEMHIFTWSFRANSTLEDFYHDYKMHLSGFLKIKGIPITDTEDEKMNFMRHWLIRREEAILKVKEYDASCKCQRVTIDDRKFIRLCDYCKEVD